MIQYQGHMVTKKKSIERFMEVGVVIKIFFLNYRGRTDRQC